MPPCMPIRPTRDIDGDDVCLGGTGLVQPLLLQRGQGTASAPGRVLVWGGGQAQGRLGGSHPQRRCLVLLHLVACRLSEKTEGKKWSPWEGWKRRGTNSPANFQIWPILNAIPGSPKFLLRIMRSQKLQDLLYVPNMGNLWLKYMTFQTTCPTSPKLLDPLLDTPIEQLHRISAPC